MLDDESTPRPDVTPEQATNDQPDDDQATGDRATGDRATGDRPSGLRPSGDEAGAEQPGAAEPSGADPATAMEPPAAEPAGQDDSPPPVKKGAAKKTAKKTAAKKAPAKKTTKKTAAKKAAAGPPAEAEPPAPEPATDADAPTADRSADEPAAPAAAALLFQPPDPAKAPPRKRAAKKAAPDRDRGPDREREPEPDSQAPGTSDDSDGAADVEDGGDTGDGGDGGQRRRRRRGGRRRRKNGGDGDDTSGADATDSAPADTSTAKTGSAKTGSAKTDDDRASDERGSDGDAAETWDEGGGSRRRRRRRRRQGEDDGGQPDDPENTVVRVRERRQVTDDEISGFTGSTRLEAKKQRRREGREAGRRRAPIVSEAEFLARREAVDRVMVVRQHDDVTQIGVLEDDVLVEHYVARESQTSLIGNVYLGRVQNVLPSMEAAFIDIGKGRNAVLYAGEVNWSVLGKEGQPRRIETALKSGQTVLVQVTKDPVGHKGARLTSQISLPGRYLVYLPGGQTSGISRKLPDTERNRLKNLLKEILPEDAGVIVRTAAEGASEDELRRDVTRLTARWDDISKKVDGGQAPQLMYGEPDLMIKVVRDLFTEDFKKLVVSGDDAWDMIEGYVGHVAPDLMDRVERWNDDADVFASYRIDEQIAKALERKVWLPSGGSLIIDRTEAMTVVDVNTGKFTGSGGNLEETVTKNNLEAAEEVVRQLRLRDLGGIIVIDFIDMVLESNRDLVLRRLIECLGRDRTRHQVAEVTSLGLVQMTRKRIGTGLLEAFSEPCDCCGGRGLHTQHEPVEPNKSKRDGDDSRRGGRRGRRGGERGGDRDKQPDKQAQKGGDKQATARDAESSNARDAEQRTDQKPDESRSGKQSKSQRGKRSRDGAEDDKARSDSGQPSAESAPAESAAAESVPAESAAAESVPEQPTPTGRDSDQPPPPGSVSPDGSSPDPQPAAHRRPRRRAASRPAGPPEHAEAR